MRTGLNAPFIGKVKEQSWRVYPIEYPNRKERNKAMSRRPDDNWVYINDETERKKCKPSEAKAIFHFTRGFRLVPAYDKKHG